ncbi:MULTISPECIES: potassium/proton antiporter [Porphyromonas]|uniref:Potassium transporter n=1 Tax=Porphyromonas canoris TaxID=36875 RepID=A0ABR4XL87_9PORP|nr:MULTISPECIES: potassium/proton antiporter [Porphyromonas]KGN69293.1 potassium transporter [Porphyromonas sp. COT-108 OH1349]KGN92595.1 potassium transporter [Porphyromonas canoris]KGN95154.1 potassium transporter [Porphyromonas sp. COT-108 OH2963]
MFTPEHFLLVGSSLIILGLILSRAGFKLGVPVLLLFLGVGMLAGEEGLGISFNDTKIAQFVGVMALTVILFSGGMDTNFKDVKPRLKEGISLATVGVLLTTLLTGTFIYYLFQLEFMPIHLTYVQSLLCAAVMSSTDSASVFSILRTKEITLKQNLRPTLELESGSNDPMAYMLTVILIQLASLGDISTFEAVFDFFRQFIIGAFVGWGMGKIAVWMVNRINLPNPSLYPILLLAFSGLIFASAYAFKGNGYLAVYIGGLIVGNSKLKFQKSVKGFFDGFAWLWQLIMFLTLGLLVVPSELFHVAIPAILIALFLIFLGRPIATFLTLLPIRSSLSNKARLYVSWMGLRGAVPIIFATYPLVAEVPNATTIFNVVFFITLLSLIIQGSTATWMAEKLDLVDEPVQKRVFDVELPEEIKSALSEIIVTQEMLAYGNTLTDIPLPRHTLAVMVLRGGHYFIPSGTTELQVEDHILLISDDQEALLAYYEETGIAPYRMEVNE